MKKRFKIVPSVHIEDNYSIIDSWNDKSYIIDYGTRDECTELVKHLERIHKLSEERRAAYRAQREADRAQREAENHL